MWLLLNTSCKHKALSFFSHSAASPPPVRKSRPGLCKKLGGDTAGQLTRTDQMDLPYHMTSCSAIKTGLEEEEGEGFFCSMLAIAWRAFLMGHSESSPLHHLVFVGGVFSPSILHLLDCLYLGSWVFLHCSSCSHCCSTGVCEGAWLLSGSTHSTWLLLKPPDH